MRFQGVTQIYIEGFTNPEPAAEGAILAVWRYQELKDKADRYPEVRVELYESDDMDGWMRGKVKAENQNLARKIEETPANLMTPYIFGQVSGADKTTRNEHLFVAFNESIYDECFPDCSR